MRSVSEGLAHVGQVSESIVSTPTRYKETGTKGLTAQPRERKEGGRPGGRGGEWSLTQDFPDIILKMQINFHFQIVKQNHGRSNTPHLERSRKQPAKLNSTHIKTKYTLNFLLNWFYR